MDPEVAALLDDLQDAVKVRHELQAESLAKSRLLEAALGALEGSLAPPMAAAVHRLPASTPVVARHDVLSSAGDATGTGQVLQFGSFSRQAAALLHGAEAGEPPAFQHAGWQAPEPVLTRAAPPTQASPRLAGVGGSGSWSAVLASQMAASAAVLDGTGAAPRASPSAAGGLAASSSAFSATRFAASPLTSSIGSNNNSNNSVLHDLEAIRARASELLQRSAGPRSPDQSRAAAAAVPGLAPLPPPPAPLPPPSPMRTRIGAGLTGTPSRRAVDGSPRVAPSPAPVPAAAVTALAAALPPAPPPLQALPQAASKQQQLVSAPAPRPRAPTTLSSSSSDSDAPDSPPRVRRASAAGGAPAPVPPPQPPPAAAPSSSSSDDDDAGLPARPPSRFTSSRRSSFTSTASSVKSARSSSLYERAMKVHAMSSKGSTVKAAEAGEEGAPVAPEPEAAAPAAAALPQPQQQQPRAASLSRAGSRRSSLASRDRVKSIYSSSSSSSSSPSPAPATRAGSPVASRPVSPLPTAVPPADAPPPPPPSVPEPNTPPKSNTPPPASPLSKPQPPSPAAHDILPTPPLATPAVTVSAAATAASGTSPAPRGDAVTSPVVTHMQAAFERAMEVRRQLKEAAEAAAAAQAAQAAAAAEAAAAARARTQAEAVAAVAAAQEAAQLRYSPASAGTSRRMDVALVGSPVPSPEPLPPAPAAPAPAPAPAPAAPASIAPPSVVDDEDDDVFEVLSLLNPAPLLPRAAAAQARQVAAARPPPPPPAAASERRASGATSATAANTVSGDASFSADTVWGLLGSAPPTPLRASQDPRRSAPGGGARQRRRSEDTVSTAPTQALDATFASEASMPHSHAPSIPDSAATGDEEEGALPFPAATVLQRAAALAQAQRVNGFGSPQGPGGPSALSVQHLFADHTSTAQRAYGAGLPLPRAYAPPAPAPRGGSGGGGGGREAALAAATRHRRAVEADRKQAALLSAYGGARRGGSSSGAGAGRGAVLREHEAPAPDPLARYDSYFQHEGATEPLLRYLDGDDDDGVGSYGEGDAVAGAAAGGEAGAGDDFATPVPAASRRATRVRVITPGPESFILIPALGNSHASSFSGSGYLPPPPPPVWRPVGSLPRELGSPPPSHAAGGASRAVRSGRAVTTSGAAYGRPRAGTSASASRSLRR